MNQQLADAAVTGSGDEANGCGGWCCLTASGLTVSALVLTVLLGVRGSPGAIFTGIVGLVAAIVAASTLATARRDAAVDFEVTLSPSPVAFGEPLKVRLEVRAKRRIRLTTGALTLLCQERAINRSGTQDQTYTHTAHEDKRPIVAATELSEGFSWSCEERFDLPVGLPASFVGRNNFIEWKVRLWLGIKGPLLDIREDYDVEVVPEIA